MTTVLVHGLPENALMWEPLQAELARPTVAVSLPGIGAPAPDRAGWTGTKDQLAEWLNEQLCALEPPIDVVAHDLGALLVMRLVMSRTCPLRSWVVDVPDLFAPAARFSPFAQRLQQEPAAVDLLRQTSERLITSDDGWARRLRAGGAPAELAARIAATHDAETDHAISAFYRSATPNVAADWSPLESADPQGRGLVLLLPDPPEVEARSRAVATRLRAETAPLKSGHCWMAKDPVPTAQLLQRFWATID